MDVSVILESWWWVLLVALGIPTFLLGRLERKLDRAEARRELREQAREQMFCGLSQSAMAAIALGEATARAVQRIPDAHCNGEMHAALEYAASIQKEQKDFLTRMGVLALCDD